MQGREYWFAFFDDDGCVQPSGAGGCQPFAFGGCEQLPGRAGGMVGTPFGNDAEPERGPQRRRAHLPRLDRGPEDLRFSAQTPPTPDRL